MLNPRYLLPILAIVAGLLALLALTAHADTGQAIDDAPSRIAELWRNGQIVPALILGVFVALTFASRKIAWLSEGNRGVYVAAALSGIGLLAERALAGTTPNLSMIVGAVTATVLALTNARAPAHVAAGAPVSTAIVSGEIKLPPKDGAS